MLVMSRLEKGREWDWKDYESLWVGRKGRTSEED